MPVQVRISRYSKLGSLYPEVAVPQKRNWLEALDTHPALRDKPRRSDTTFSRTGKDKEEATEKPAPAPVTSTTPGVVGTTAAGVKSQPFPLRKQVDLNMWTKRIQNVLNHPALQPPKNNKLRIGSDLDEENDDYDDEDPGYCTVYMDIPESNSPADQLETEHCMNLAKTIQDWLQRIKFEDEFPWDELTARDNWYVMSTSPKMEPFPNIEWSQIKAYSVRGGRRDIRGKLHGRVTIVLEDGDEIYGNFANGKREGKCTLSCRTKGVSELTGSYRKDILDGKVKVMFTDGSVEEGYVRGGTWHGSLRTFNKDGNLTLVGRNRNGKLMGTAWKFLRGGGALHGPVNCMGKFSGEDIVYLYPDLETGLKGLFVDGVMVFGREVSVRNASIIKGILKLEVSSPDLNGEPYRPMLRGSNPSILSNQPLQPDVYERKTIYCKSSRVGEGDGIFAKRSLEVGAVVAFYNGIRYFDGEPDGSSWSDRAYRIAIGDDILDIPSDCRSVTNYCASMAHKINHSFNPNTEFWEVDHPVFGHIPCVRTIQKISKGEELTVCYNYLLDDCPTWYSDLWETMGCKNR